MPRYRLTEEVLDRLLPLSVIPAPDFAAFLAELESNLPISLNIEADIERFVGTQEHAALHSLPNWRQLAEALTGVHFLRVSAGATDDEFLLDVERAWKADERADLETLTVNLRSVLQSRLLRASSKALSLISDHDKLYLSSRILTDIRPVFEDDVSSPMLTSLITHMLRMNLQVDGGSEVIYIAMDSNDLRQLRSTIDRALRKAESLRTRVGAGSLSAPLDMPEEPKP